MMSAQNAMQTSTPRSGEQRGQRNELARRSGLPLVPSLLLDPLGFFDDNPFALLRRMQREMNRAFSQPGDSGDLTTAAWTPPVEVSYRDGNLVVSAELPGLTDKDFKVEVTNDMLTIQGERRIEEERTEGGVHLTERKYGQFYRAIALPEGANAEQAKAEFQNGVLRITVPVAEQPKNQRQIPIQTTGSSEQSQSGQQKAPTSEGTSKEKAA
jgi:HSP20 family protein